MTSLAQFLADVLYAAALAATSDAAHRFVPATYPRLSNDDLLIEEWSREIAFRLDDVLADWSQDA